MGPKFSAEIWEHGDEWIVTVNGKPVGKSMAQTSCVTVARWLEAGGWSELLERLGGCGGHAASSDSKPSTSAPLRYGDAAALADAIFSAPSKVSGPLHVGPDGKADDDYYGKED